VPGGLSEAGFLRNGSGVKSIEIKVSRQKGVHLMGVSEHDHDITRRYLLGQLTDDEEQKLEERLLSEDDFFQQVELTKDELAQEYASGELTTKERKWLQETFLASPEGKQRHEFAKTFDHYLKNHRAQRQKSPSLIERLRTIWNSQPQLLTAASTAAVLVIAIGIYSIMPPTPRSIASLTVTTNASTRSTGAAPQSVRIRDYDALKLTLRLPQAGSPGAAYRVEVNGDNVTRTFDTHAQDTYSISVEIPTAELQRGLYSATVSTIDANGNAHRLPDNYTFIIE
jgi:anti-sigma-K factor RskA